MISVSFCINFVVVVFMFIVTIGRVSMSVFGLVEAPEMYTASIGLYILWISIRVSVAILPHASQGVVRFLKQLIAWLGLILKCTLAGVIIFVIIPLIVGHLVELILLSPLRVPVYKFPVFYPSTVS